MAGWRRPTRSTTAPTPTAPGASLFKSIESGKLVVLCDDCARYVELNARDRFLLVLL